MRKSEVATLLAFIAAFDHRTVGAADVEAWSTLDTIQRTDLATAQRAVVLFFEQTPPDRGPAPYLDPRELKRYIRVARDEAEREEARRRALRALPAGREEYTRPENFHEQVEAAREATEAERAAARRYVEALRNGTSGALRMPS